MIYRAFRASIFALAAGAVATGSAFAEDQPAATDRNVAMVENRLEEIVVTAEHRTENLQTTPLAVSAVSGKELVDRQIVDVQVLSTAVPNVNFSTYNNSARIAIRGIGDDAISPGAEARTAFHADGVYLSRPQGAMAAFMDVSRIEVVRGPQGTLYGRNATGGAINVITKDPTDNLDGYANLTLGNYDLVRLNGAIGGPIATDLSGRLAVQATSRGGYGLDTTTGKEIDDDKSRAVRGKLKYDFTPKSYVILTADFFNQHDRSGGWHYLGEGARTESGDPGVTPFPLIQGGIVPSDPRNITADLTPKTDRQTSGVSAAFNIDLDWATLTSISAHRNVHDRVLLDYDMTNLNRAIYDISEKSEQFSQEFRLQGNFSRGNWLAGAYYFREKEHGELAVPLDQALYFGPPGYVQGYYIKGDINTDAYAIFGQVNVPLAEKTSLVLGGRYSTERKSISEGLAFDTVTPYTGTVAPGTLLTDRKSDTWKAFTPRVSIEYRPTSDIFTYVTYAKGFKSGGFNLGGLQPPFGTESLTDYEMGVKANWLGDRLRTNLALFDYDYKDLQVTKVDGTVLVVDNAAKAKVYGAELELAALLTPQLKVDLNLALLRSKYTSFVNQDPAHPALGNLNLSGNALNQSPKYNAMLGVQYDFPTSWGDLTLRAEGYAVDKVYFSALNQDYVGQDAYKKYNLFATFEPSGGHWTLRLFARNVGNVTTKASSVVGSGIAGFMISGAYDPPRTYGGEIGYRF